ncbi:MAG: hypothetical protein F6K03_10525 [Kamptonema sp. SIO4C4]|nr:hypothetical protein [Kamptonema sp. SIO4C4]
MPKHIPPLKVVGFQHRFSVIVTRNTPDFALAAIPAFGLEEFLKTL